ncbi:mutase-like protein [Seminavis robusta]|uniref:Mutase-like protein n=1 Tax=Seminavis robusta TaxID=568900 RepID=A0A9N8EZC0_9STRA|nr:mutase-like protein [Seminavis robusta]|eukprot:Sro2558_g331220.1 mutase-like protein (275) ;mRNA; r:8550-9463
MSAPTAESAKALEIDQKDMEEHMQGMPKVYASMRDRPLTVKAYAFDDPKAPVDAVVVHFVRHGQGFHNLIASLFSCQGKEWEPYSQTRDNPYIMQEILDAPLTQKGRQQACLLQPKIKELKTKPQLVVLSPLCRALQTGVIAFEELLVAADVPFLAHEMVREQSSVHCCDKRRPISRQAKEFPQVDFSRIESDEDVIFKYDKPESIAEVGERAYKFLQWLSERPEKHVGVSSHSAWLFTVFNGVLECDDSLKDWFHTGEMRSVKLEFIQKFEKP